MDKSKVLSNLIWRYAERMGAQGVGLIVSIILARMLTPDDYGVVALVGVFIAVLNVFVDSGLGTALIQKKNADDIDFSSVFWFNIFMCTISYVVLFVFSPVIANSYHRPELTMILRVLGIQIIISGIKNVQQAYVSRTMQFKRFFFATLGGTVGAAAIGIWMAWKGFGAWALVTQQIFNVLVDTIVLWMTVKWRPKVLFSFERLKGLFSFGWKLLVSSLLGTAYLNLRQLIIGSVYSPSDLAFYNKGDKYPYTIITSLDSSLGSVLLPVMSTEQDKAERVRMMTRRAIKTSTYLVAPLLIGLAAIGESFIRVLLTDKWLPALPYLQVFCVYYLFYPITTANLNAINAMGRSDLYLKLEIIKKAIGLITILIAMRISAFAMALSMLITAPIGQMINCWPNRKLMNYTFWDQMKDIFPEISLTMVMAALIYLLNYLPLSNLPKMILQILAGVLIYLFGSRMFHLESYEYTLSTVKGLFSKK